MERKAFNKAGDTEEKTTWNAAGTRKWKMTYTLLEVQPSWRKAKASDSKKESGSKKAPAKSNTKKSTKPTKKTSKSPKRATKAKAKPKTKKAKSKKLTR